MTTTVSPLLRGEGLPEFRAITPELVSRDWRLVAHVGALTLYWKVLWS